MMKRLRRLFSVRNCSGYTLVEVIVSTVLLGILIIGVMLFMAPLFQNVDDNIKVSRADTVATAMQNYITKTLKNAQYVKVYTGVSQAKMVEITKSISGELEADNPAVDYKSMAQIITNHKDTRTMGCISLRYVQDKNPRDGTYKYILCNETIKLPEEIYTDSNITAAQTFEVVSSLSNPVFDSSFYEGLYPEVAFERGFDLNTDGDNDRSTTPTDVKNHGYIATINMYDEVGKIDTTTQKIEYNVGSLLLTGVGAIELNNIKSLEVNPSGEFCTYANTDLNNGQDIYIFYVIRKHK